MKLRIHRIIFTDVIGGVGFKDCESELLGNFNISHLNGGHFAVFEGYKMCRVSGSRTPKKIWILF